MASIEQRIRAVPLWLLEQYLTELGGERNHSGEVQGDGWRARLTQEEDYEIESLSVGQVHLELKGNDEAIQQVWENLEPKLQRAGA
jgi:hypothetical protein